MGHHPDLGVAGEEEMDFVSTVHYHTQNKAKKIYKPLLFHILTISLMLLGVLTTLFGECTKITSWLSTDTLT